MKKSTYILLVVGLLIGSLVMGWYDEGDVLATVILSMLLLPAICDNKKVKRNAKSK